MSFKVNSFWSPLPSTYVISWLSGMFSKSRASVSLAWILLVLVTYKASKTSSHLEDQFWLTDSTTFHSVNVDTYQTFSASHCTVQELSCDIDGEMSCLTSDQKQKMRKVYKFGRKTVHFESHFEFLGKCLKNTLPGNLRTNQERIDKISNDAIVDEREQHKNKLNWARAEFDKAKNELFEVFEEEHAKKEVKRIENHMRKVKIRRKEKQEKKLPSCSDKTASTDDLPEGWNNIFTVTNKRRRRFKRKYNQPQPKRTRKHRSSNTIEQHEVENLPEGWNGIIKNISGQPVTNVEESLFLKGKKCKKDPPINRMQRQKLED